MSELKAFGLALMVVCSSGFLIVVTRPLDRVLIGTY